MKKECKTENFLQALQASETRYRRLFETAQDGMLILNAETGEIDDVNPYMIDMLHYSHEEFLGKKLWEVSPFRDTVLNRAAFEELQDKGYIRYRDLPLETKEGKSIAVEFVSNVYRANGHKVIQCNIRNVTEQKDANQKLREAVIFQQRLIDALPVPIYFKDSESRYLGCNVSFEKLLGQKRERITGKSANELSPKEWADVNHGKDLALLQNPGIQIYESAVKDGGGVPHHVIFHKATFSNIDGSVGGLIGAVLDITDLKRAEEALSRKTMLLEAQAETSIDGILAVDGAGHTILFNKRFGEICKIPRHILDTKDDAAMLGYILNQLKDPREFSCKVKYLYEHRDEKSGDEIELVDGRYLDRYSSPLLSTDGQYLGRIWFFRDVTARRQAEEALTKSEEKFRKVFYTSPDSISISRLADGMFSSINPGFTKITGYTEADVIGKTSVEYNIWGNVEDRQRLIAGLKKDGEVTNIEAAFRTKSGNIRYGLVSASIMDVDGVPHILSIVRDITNRKLTEAELTENEKKYRLLADNVKDVIFVLDMNLNYTFISPSVKVLRGYEPEELLQQPSIRTLTPSSWNLAMETISEVMALEKSGHQEIPMSRTLQLEMTRRDGTTVWTEVKLSFIRDESQQAVAILGVTRDISERKQADEELKRAYLILHETNEQLLQADKMAATGTLAAGVAHEILNPLNIIAVGIAALETTRDLPEPVKEAFVIFQRQIDRAVRITRDLQKFSRKSLKKAEATDLRKLMQDTLDLCEPRLKVERVHPSMDSDVAVPEVHLDRQRMEQVFLNIINNAIDAMAEIETKELRIKIKSLRDSEYKVKGVLIVFSDQGQGIREEDMDRLFDPFFTTKAVGKGTGLGLSISRSIVQNHDGRIWAENNPEGGAAFHIELPLTIDQDRAK